MGNRLSKRTLNRGDLAFQRYIPDLKFKKGFGSFATGRKEAAGFVGGDVGAVAEKEIATA